METRNPSGTIPPGSGFSAGILIAFSRALLRDDTAEQALEMLVHDLTGVFPCTIAAACLRTGPDGILRYCALWQKSEGDESASPLGQASRSSTSAVELDSEVRIGKAPCGLALETDEPVQKRIGTSIVLEVPARSGGSIFAVLSLSMPLDVPSDTILEAFATLRTAAQMLEDHALMRARIMAQREELREFPLGTSGFAGAASSPGSSAYSGLEYGTQGSEHSPLSWCGIVGNSDAMREVFTMIERVATTDASVLLLGESGTGKELIARAIHAKSHRSSQAFIAVNCAALPESVIESELFGHEKGAFTGAFERRRGRFEEADGGTLFLDEIGELSPAIQIKLLRFLQDHRFERVGGNATLHSDVRVIAATNRNLQEAVDAGTFRADLYYRLNVFPITVPPLRDRGADILLLADHFIAKFNRENTRKIQRISTPALDLLTMYHWPGNVRELENCILRAAILSTDGVIHAYHLPPSLQSAASTGTEPVSGLDAALARLEKELIVEALKLERGNVAAAARRLGATERRVRYAIQRYRVDPRRFKTKL